ncbi:MAG: hypothetical protein M1833_003336 [Piccolia ochrophora]|nr:MAG: hypothetical protein M1833_003336 [Piccolia ochrophora]
MLKQLDIRSIDWSEVAGQLNITNGHAARMRYSRFKQAMEGFVPAPRKRTATGDGTRPKKAAKTDLGKEDNTKAKQDDDEVPTSPVKREPRECRFTNSYAPTVDVKEEDVVEVVKQEPKDPVFPPTREQSTSLEQAWGQMSFDSPHNTIASPSSPPQLQYTREFAPFSDAFPATVVPAEESSYPQSLVKQESRDD